MNDSMQAKAGHRFVVGALAGALAGCGGGTGGTEATTAGTEATEATTASTTEATETTAGTEATETTAGTEATTDSTTEGTTDTTTDGLCGEPFEPTPTLVPTLYGPVEGEAYGDGYRFLGIPFAAPPVGDLRFRPPEDPPCHEAPLAATAYGAACIQLTGDNFGNVDGMQGAEDCLTLNVWTPQADDAKRPVMAFIHGGGNAIGSAVEPLIEGSSLSAAGDVVVVNFNYRLAALGFLTHPALAAEQAAGVSGNYGTLDQVKALEWIRDNIASFGGDPDNVTLFGESAGAVNTCTLLGVPAAEGLFHKAIIESGACTQRTLADYSAQISDPWIANSSCAAAPDVPACLRALTAEDIVQLEPNGYPSVAAFSQGFGPHIDGHVLPQRAIEAMAAGEHHHMPIIVGANAEETANSVPPLTEAAYTALVQATFGFFGQATVDEILALYSIAEYGDAKGAYTALSSDLKFICTARQSARAAASGQQEPVYRYHFAYVAARAA